MCLRPALFEPVSRNSVLLLATGAVGIRVVIALSTPAWLVDTVQRRVFGEYFMPNLSRIGDLPIMCAKFCYKFG